MSDTPTTLETAGTPSTPVSDPIDSLTFDDIWKDDDTPTTSEVVHISASQPEPAEEIEEVEAEAPVRDATGKFAKKDADEEVDGDAEGEAPKVESRPFQYRALGETRALDTWKEDAEGNVVVPAAEIGTLREAMNAKHLVEGQYAPLIERYKGENAQLKTQLQQITQTRSAADARAEALVKSLMSIAEIPDEVESLEQFYQFRQKLPLLLAKAEAEHFKTLATKGPQAKPEAARPEPVDTPYALPSPQEAVTTTMEYVEHAKLDSKYRDITADDWKQYEARITRSPLAFIRPASAEEATQYGVRQGQPVFDTDAYEADITEYVTALRTSRETAKAQAKVHAENATRTQPSIKAPPSAKGGAKPSKESGRPQFQSKKDVDAWFDSDEL